MGPDGAMREEWASNKGFPLLPPSYTTSPFPASNLTLKGICLIPECKIQLLHLFIAFTSVLPWGREESRYPFGRVWIPFSHPQALREPRLRAGPVPGEQKGRGGEGCVEDKGLLHWLGDHEHPSSGDQ